MTEDRKFWLKAVEEQRAARERAEDKVIELRSEVTSLRDQVRRLELAARNSVSRETFGALTERVNLLLDDNEELTFLVGGLRDQNDRLEREVASLKDQMVTQSAEELFKSHIGGVAVKAIMAFSAQERGVACTCWRRRRMLPGVNVTPVPTQDE